VTGKMAAGAERLGQTGTPPPVGLALTMIKDLLTSSFLRDAKPIG
jgi:hypothetical protein